MNDDASMRFEWNEKTQKYEPCYDTRGRFISKPETCKDWNTFAKYVHDTEGYTPDPHDKFHLWMFRIFQAGMEYVILNIR